ncbi:hypothetical protein P7F60_02105 [Rhizobium sp. YJ-22]|nr:hypothetical protein [Rhizobium sp. YJ-22]MBN9031048.1 hypothetical protein [Hyphomicrobiales bacterium]MDG3575166.1 hypothetical protein [Rhizobium sp. YJ-22]
MNTPSRRATAIAIAEDRHARLVFIARALVSALCASVALLSLSGIDPV